MTKLRKTATALLLSAVILLGGCAERGTAPASGADTNTSSDVSDGNSSESSIDSEIDPYIEEFPVENITMPDGSVVSKYEAADGSVSALDFDFAYIHYMDDEKPLRTTFDDPPLLDSECEEIIKDVQGITPTYVKVKAGDKLENGLVVRSAVSHISLDANGLDPYLNAAEIEFEGRLTLSGKLYYSADEDRGLFFLGDPSRSDPLPLLDEPFIGFSDSMCGFESINNYPPVRLGGDPIPGASHRIVTLPGDFSDIIAPGEIADVKITVEDISEFSYAAGGPISPMVYFTITSAEPL